MGHPTASCKEREAAEGAALGLRRPTGLNPKGQEDPAHPGVSTASLNLLVMVDLPLVHKDTAPLGDVKAIHTCVFCGAGERGSSASLRATRESPCLPCMSLPPDGGLE
jgi:hypothetical protein